MLKNLLVEENTFLRVIEIDNKIIAYCLGFDHYTFFANGKVSWVEEIMVMEKYRGKKLGALLMKEFETWAKNRNSRLVSLATRRASAFYKALNYEESAVYFRKLL
jgi:GNAT superfamily N-acetyltransferase